MKKIIELKVDVDFLWVEGIIKMLSVPAAANRTSSPPGWSTKKFVTSYAYFWKNRGNVLELKQEFVRNKAKNVICFDN